MSEAQLTIDVISDVVCPWCYIGKRRLEKALLTIDTPVNVRWRPYQLDATIPPEGKDRQAYLEAKFGSPERIREMQERVSAVGAEEEISFAFDRIKVSPNTLDAHRLIRWAGEVGQQDAMVEALFRAFFLEGCNLGNHNVLAETAASTGMDAGVVAARLESGEDCAQVRSAVDSAQRMGVSGVPTCILANRYALVGAQPAETIAEALGKLLSAA